MSFQPDKLRLENEFEVLKQQSSSTSENWDDSVRRRFYDQFIDSLPKQFMAYINELNKLDGAFESSERNISELQK